MTGDCAMWDSRAVENEVLEALRKLRLAELQAKHGNPGDAARARFSNLALVKPEKTKAIENYLMARHGQLNGKVSVRTRFSGNT
ncbi:hypothetical protein U0070_012578 [Myodes glareolus]|uniref:Uncharacterized protein n=1 Tax=Myodes glareolus TaxID=447135 RepID=A0AAW0HBI4_MYOGA